MRLFAKNEIVNTATKGTRTLYGIAQDAPIRVVSQCSFTGIVEIDTLHIKDRKPLTVWIDAGQLRHIPVKCPAGCIVRHSH